MLQKSVVSQSRLDKLLVMKRRACGPFIFLIQVGTLAQKQSYTMSPEELNCYVLFATWDAQRAKMLCVSIFESRACGPSTTAARYPEESFFPCEKTGCTSIERASERDCRLCPTGTNRTPAHTAAWSACVSYNTTFPIFKT